MITNRNGYQVRRVEGYAWDFYYKLNGSDKPFHINSRYKTHITIHRDDLEKAKPLVVAFLQQKKVHGFKVVISQDEVLGNVRGKEVVIYMHRHTQNDVAEYETQSQYWIDLLTELEGLLLRNQIRPGVVGAGLSMYPGSKGYVYYRDSHNIFNRYVSIDDQVSVGFTNEEAKHISPPRLLEWHGLKGLHTDAKDYKQLAAHKDDCKVVANKSYPVAITWKAIADMKRDDINIADVYCRDIRDNIQNLVCGSREERPHLDPNQRLIDLFANISPLKFGVLDSKIDDFDSQLEKNKKYLGYILYDCLLMAEKMIFAIVHHLGIERYIRGSVAGAVYLYFCLPLVEKWKVNPYVSAGQIIDPEILIKNIVKFALRKARENVVDSDQFSGITYFGNITEENFDSVFESAKRVVDVTPIRCLDDKGLTLRGVCELGELADERVQNAISELKNYRDERALQRINDGSEYSGWFSWFKRPEKTMATNKISAADKLQKLFAGDVVDPHTKAEWDAMFDDSYGRLGKMVERFKKMNILPKITLADEKQNRRVGKA